ncbi:hypothetical protein SAMN04489724_1270 [Algoriphagus locisalis]|uniref:Uncharacterized protein n=1 Tax=Algoriphagus locisalis TaxID=305507 RepID=A0A1I6YWM5_9BACT|nr:hypothetical protein [Algoriphagus locisalis]SFT54817.1 hypothetical protein SAMN04489724_1270 [Algoriphagus locisalis]
MTGLIVLDVFISLVFIYLLYSLLAMTVIETITSSFSSRSKNLITGIDRLLADDQQSSQINHTMLNLFWVKTINPLTKAFFAHPSIKYLGHKGLNSKPSYIAKDRFASTLVDLLKKGQYLDDVDNIEATLDLIPKFDYTKLESKIALLEEELVILKQSEAPNKFEIESLVEEIDFQKAELFKRTSADFDWEISGLSIGTETKYQLKLLWEQAATDVEKFKALIENWYDDQMDRIAGWFKRKVTYFTFIIGFVLAVIFQVDSIKLAEDLSVNDEMRELYVEGARDFLANNPSGIDSTTTKKNKDFLDAWSEEVKQHSQTLSTRKSTAEIQIFWLNAENSKKILTWLGYLITAFAVSLGAPFWFDILNKLMKVRNSIQIPIGQKSNGTQASNEDTTQTIG